MKRLVSILLTMLLLLGLTACGGGAADTAGDQTGTGADEPGAQRRRAPLFFAAPGLSGSPR